MAKKDKDNRQNDSEESLSLYKDGVVGEAIISSDENSHNTNTSNTAQEQSVNSNVGSTNSQSNSTSNASLTSSSNSSISTTDTVSEDIVGAANTLKSINTIKEELCKLPLDLCERQYFDNRVVPLLTTINFLSSTSDSLAVSVNTLTSSPIVPRKKGKIKDTINLIYSMNSKCKDIYKELENRIDIMLKEE